MHVPYHPALDPTFIDHSINSDSHRRVHQCGRRSRCAVNFQVGTAERNAETSEDRRIELRIGVKLGDVMVRDDDVYGDGVNVAAQLEGLVYPVIRSRRGYRRS